MAKTRIGLGAAINNHADQWITKNAKRFWKLLILIRFISYIISCLITEVYKLC